MPTVEKRLLTEQEYLRRERAAEYKSEFYRGEMFAMAGASRRHNLIAAAIARLLGNQLVDQSCEVYASDMRVKVSATGLYTYPDVVVTCDGPRFEDEQVDTLLNPKVLIEILSDATEKYDRGAKWAQYRELPSLQEYVLVSQDSPLVECYLRQPEGNWLLRSSNSLADELRLESLDVRIPLAEVYRQIEFPPPQLRPRPAE